MRASARVIKLAALAALLYLANSSALWTVSASSVHCDEMCDDYADCDAVCMYVPGPEYEVIETTCGVYGQCITPCVCGDGLCNGALSGCTESCASCPADCGGPCLEPGETGYCGMCSGDLDCGPNSYCDAGGCCVWSPKEPHPDRPECYENSQCDRSQDQICKNHSCVKSGTDLCTEDADCGRAGTVQTCVGGRCK